jgi:sister-chromatid-cohesion protein PDS5
VLKSLAEVKSIILLLDVPNASKLTEALFKHCFDVLGGGPTKSNSGEELSKNVEHNMTGVLSTLIEESQNLSEEVVKTVVAQFLRTSPKVATSGPTKGKKAAPVEESQATLQMKEAPPAYNMAQTLCNANPDKMGSYVSKYVNSVLTPEEGRIISEESTSTKRSKRRTSDDVDDTAEESLKLDLEAVTRVHELLREIWRSCPSILPNVITQQLEMELVGETSDTRLLAVEAIADMISGIGHAGPPPPKALDPVVYPSQSLVSTVDKRAPYNFLTTPTSPVSFIAKYYKVYQEFLNRRNDKLTSVRAAWVTGVGRILMTSAGGVGLESEEEEKLLKYFAACLVDFDEHVRFNAIVAIEQFDFEDIIQKLGRNGGVSEPGSLLSNLAQRVKDKKPKVRTEAIKILAKIWGVAVGAIAAGSDRVTELLGSIPSTILEAYYINEREIHALVDRVLYESMLPLKFPDMRSKPHANGHSQRVKENQGAGEDGGEQDPDKIRSERILILIKDLEPRAKSVLFSLQNKQTDHAKVMDAFLERCESYNGGVMDTDEKGIKLQLGKLIDYTAQQLPDPAKVTEDLWKFAQTHDRRSYQLIRFCMAADSDHDKIRKSIRELSKRIEEASGSTTTLLDTITLLVYRCSILLYNRSHVPAIIEYSRTNENGLGAAAHEVLKEISKNKSEVFKAHVQDLCKSLALEAPSAKKPNGRGAVDDLKACAEFARKFPEDVPKDRKFMQAMLGFVSHGTPPKAAKYGVLIILTTANKKEAYAKDIFKQCTQGFEYGSGNYLARLAALSQLMLLGADYLEESETDVVVHIAIKQVLTNPDATPEPDEGDPDPAWTSELDDNCAAKFWALKILVNRLRGYPEDSSVIEGASQPVFQFLNTLVQKHGQITKTRRSPKAHQSRLRLVGAQLLLKLCCEKRFNQRLTPTAFNALATVAMDPNPQVRAGFTNKIMKYLGQQKLTMRFYTPLFLLGHEPDSTIRDRSITWLKSRAAAFARSKDTSMEAAFARLLSLLAHHPDWLGDGDDDGVEKTEAQETEDLCETLTGFLGFITFYLKCVATRDNLSLIYHVAQRVKAVQDGITPADKPNKVEGAENVRIMNERLYMLSEMSMDAIRQFESLNSWSLQAWPGKVSMPGGIFMKLPDHETAQNVAMKQYLPKEFVEDLEGLVKAAFRSKKVCNSFGFPTLSGLLTL